jgi:hypothetical protein
MVVFGSQCPNSDTDSVVESRNTWRMAQKWRFALTDRLTDRLLQTSIFDERVGPPSLTRWAVDVWSSNRKLNHYRGIGQYFSTESVNQDFGVRMGSECNERAQICKNGAAIGKERPWFTTPGI